MCLESWENHCDLPNDPKGIHAHPDRQCPKDMARQRACLTRGHWEMAARTQHVERGGGEREKRRGGRREGGELYLVLSPDDLVGEDVITSVSCPARKLRKPT